MSARLPSPFCALHAHALVPVSATRATRATRATLCMERSEDRLSGVSLLISIAWDSLSLFLLCSPGHLGHQSAETVSPLPTSTHTPNCKSMQRTWQIKSPFHILISLWVNQPLLQNMACKQSLLSHGPPIMLPTAPLAKQKSLGSSESHLSHFACHILLVSITDNDKAMKLSPLSSPDFQF